MIRKDIEFAKKTIEFNHYVAYMKLTGVISVPRNLTVISGKMAPFVVMKGKRMLMNVPPATGPNNGDTESDVAKLASETSIQEISSRNGSK